MWSQLIGSVALWLGGVTSTLAVAEILLDNSQKTWIRKRLEDVWLYLAGQSRGQFLLLLARRSVQIVLGATSYIATWFIVSHGVGPTTFNDTYGMFDLSNFKGPIGTEWTIFLVYMMLFGTLAHPWIFSRVLHAMGWGKPFRRLLIGTVTLLFTFGLLCILTMVLMETDFGKSCLERPVFADWPEFKVKVCRTPVWEWLLAPVIAEVWSVQITIWFTLMWTIASAALLILLIVVQGLVYRIATYEKGPVFALSALLGSMGAALKVFL